MAVSQIGPDIADKAIPSLFKALKEGLINRQTISETIISLGIKGEQTLLQFLKEDLKASLKFKECLVRSLALANVESPNIDFVVEALFETYRDLNPKVRKASLISLDILHKRANDRVTYLKPINLLPFFFKALSDKSPLVRKSALLCIQNFGPQGELLLIEGFTKDKSAKIRAACAQGLVHFGARCYRVLMTGLHDKS